MSRDNQRDSLLFPMWREALVSLRWVAHHAPWPRDGVPDFRGRSRQEAGSGDNDGPEIKPVTRRRGQALIERLVAIDTIPALERGIKRIGSS